MWQRIKSDASQLMSVLGAGAARGIQQRALVSAGQTSPATQSQGASLSGVSSTTPSIVDSLEGSLSAALEKSTLGVVASAQSALHAEVKKAEGDALVVVAAAIAGGLLYAANPLIGAGVGAGLALLYTSSQ